MDIENLTQIELADILGVDRSTIQSWSRQGMPHRKPEKNGLPASYNGPICINWQQGHKVARAKNLDLSPLDKIAAGWACGTEGKPSAKEQEFFLDGLLADGYTRDDVLTAMGFARGLLMR
jgi:hypothetical protein